MCCEIMVANVAIRSGIREGKIHQMDSMIQVGAKYGMQTMNQALLSAYRNNLVAKEVALSRSNDQIDLNNMMNREARASHAAGDNES